MSVSRDIISVVEELSAGFQDYKDGCIVDDAALFDDICKFFPAIAQALEIAVETLEVQAKHEDMMILEEDHKSAKKALTQIRSSKYKL